MPLSDVHDALADVLVGGHPQPAYRGTTLSMSMLGVCRRQAAYALSGRRWASSESPVATLGTLIHEALLPHLAKRLNGAYEIETEWQSPLGKIPGKIDLLTKTSVVDLKTVSHGWWDEQPSDRQRYQVTAGALATGREEAGVLVLSRQDGGFRLHPVDVEQSADDLLGWLADVHEPEDTERDFRGPGIDRECEWCPFRAECWPDQPDAEPQAVLVQTDDAREMALAEYDSARERVSRAESDMAFWRATLTGSQGGSYGPWALSWSRGTSSRLDVAAAREMLVEAGLPVPVKISRSTRIHVGKV